MNKYLKELVILILLSIPFVYLAYNWENLPAQVATHFDLAGNPNGWTAKDQFIYLLLGLGFGVYLLMILIPKFDPKKKIEQMGNKYFSLRLVMSIFMSAISMHIIYSGNGNKIDLSILIILTGTFFIIFGNYLQTVKPNYFIGIRTPWTLENDRTWRKTHRLAGRMWMIAGVIVLILSFLIKNSFILGISFATITFTIVTVPIVYSYIEFKNSKQ